MTTMTERTEHAQLCDMYTRVRSTVSRASLTIATLHVRASRGTVEKFESSWDVSRDTDS